MWLPTLLCVVLANPALKLQLFGLVHDFCLRNHETFVAHSLYNMKSSLSVSLLYLCLPVMNISIVKTIPLETNTAISIMLF